MITIPGRIPIIIHPFFWFLIFILGWLNSGTPIGTGIWAVVILISVLVHEYGHALTARIFGQEAEINLIGLGGLTKREGPKLKRWQDFVVVLNGPLFGLILFFICYQLLNIIGQKHSMLHYALEVGVNVNLVWTLLNLVPVFPLDGGHLFRIILESVFGVRGLKAAFIFSMVLAVIIGLYFFMGHLIIMGAIFFMLAFESYQAWSGVKSLTPEDVNEELQDTMKDGIEKMHAGNLTEAFELFSLVREKASKGKLYVSATQNAARILAEQGNYKAAYQWLLPIKNRLSAEYLQLLQQLAYRLQEWEESAEVGEMVYKQIPSIDTALLNSLAYGIMGKAIPAVGWLRCCVQLGMQDVQNVVNKREFDSIRESPPFQKWVKSTH